MTISSRADNGSAPVLPGCPIDDSSETREMVKRVEMLMKIHGVHCGNLGGHTIGSMPRHHHHDYGCLIEAGAAEPSRLMREAKAEVERLQDHNAEHHREISILLEDADVDRRFKMDLLSYIGNTPDPSGVGSVADHFETWLKRTQRRRRKEITPEALRAAFVGPDLGTEAGMTAMFGRPRVRR